MSITDWTRQALPAMLDDLKALVELETHSYDKAALVQGLRGVRALATERLGAPDIEVVHDGGQYGDVLELTYHGHRARHGADDQPLRHRLARRHARRLAVHGGGRQGRPGPACST